MAELEALALFKNVFLAPLTRAKPQPAAAVEPPAHASSHVTRHDHHNIEIKIVSELTSAPSIVETDLFVFVPRNFEIESYGKAELMKDFRTRIRLALPMTGDQGAAAFETALLQFRESIIRLSSMNEIGEVNASVQAAAEEEALESTKDLCGVIAETLKHGAIEHARQFFLSHTLLTTSDACRKGLEALGNQVIAMHDMIARVRSLELTPRMADHTIVALFHEYVSQLYVQYLSTIRTELSRIERPKIEYEATSYGLTRKRLESTLNRLQEEEAQYRRQLGSHHNGRESELDREQRLVRMSHLKKFFQSKTFVDVTREQSAKKVSESTATLATVIAGLTAGLLEMTTRPGVGDVASHGFAFFWFIGIVLYVLRDRMKDWAKARFHEKALQFLPDYEQQLVANRNKIGRVKEWFHVMKSSQVPAAILKMRQDASATLMEKKLPEDVFHCRKVQELQSSKSATGKLQFSRALHENTRVNFERYLKHMDDPFKDIADLDAKGRFLRSRSHRVYHFYLCIRTQTRPLENGLGSRLKPNVEFDPRRMEQHTSLYRVVADKNGIVRLETLVV